MRSELLKWGTDIFNRLRAPSPFFISPELPMSWQTNDWERRIRMYENFQMWCRKSRNQGPFYSSLQDSFFPAKDLSHLYHIFHNQHYQLKFENQISNLKYSRSPLKRYTIKIKSLFSKFQLSSIITEAKPSLKQSEEILFWWEQKLYLRFAGILTERRLISLFAFHIVMIFPKPVEDPIEIFFPDPSNRSQTFHLYSLERIPSRSETPVQFGDSTVVDSWNPRTSPSLSPLNNIGSIIQSP